MAISGGPSSAACPRGAGSQPPATTCVGATDDDHTNDRATRPCVAMRIRLDTTGTQFDRPRAAPSLPSGSAARRTGHARRRRCWGHGLAAREPVPQSQTYPGPRSRRRRDRGAACLSGTSAARGARPSPTPPRLPIMNSITPPRSTRSSASMFRRLILRRVEPPRYARPAAVAACPGRSRRAGTRPRQVVTLHRLTPAVTHGHAGINGASR